MTELSNNQGRAFEYVTLVTLFNKIRQIRSAVIERNSSFDAAERAWNSISTNVKANLRQAANAVLDSIFDLEPRILEDGNDILTLFLQPDTQGEAGDVRDIIIVRRNIHWEIGLSLKHNHHAVKHSRLAKTLDFGKNWYGIPCSQTYWDRVRNIFEFLENRKGESWHIFPNKEEDIYIPLLEAFIAEIRTAARQDTEVPRKMVEYLLGKYDFYKIISIDSKRVTQLQAFNLRGTLNQRSQNEKPVLIIPRSTLPSRIVCINLKPGSKTTVELYMDNGWQFSFRIHNASSRVEPSLKFDIQFTGMPATIVSINCVWHYTSESHIAFAAEPSPEYNPH